MKVSLNWLKEYVDITLPVNDLVDQLAMAGFEAKSVEVIGENWDNVIVGQLLEVNPHPNADRLRLTTVDLGSEQETVVCGAPNLNVGDKIAFARVGAQLFDGYSGQLAVLKSAKIRGVVSSGMVCSEKELGISDRHEGILVLPDEAAVGMPLADFMGDVIINLDITPNRPDCLSVIGIAREIAALTGQNLHINVVDYDETGSSIDEQVSVEIKDPDLCSRYCASLVTGVKLADSPGWMQQRLLASGMRPINNLVDITNYIMLEYGQPMHSFDYQTITDRKIIVRQAVAGEKIVTLDGVTRSLTDDTLVIADSERVIAVAGVMGGANSEVADDTVEILLESASFNPASIHYTGQALGLPSEACMRFERGISTDLTLPALKRATQLLVELGGGQVAKGLIDVYPGKVEPEPVSLSVSEVERVLGVKFSFEEVKKTLTSLGFDCNSSASDSEILVKTPYWRSDIHQDVDLIEEVARIIGYEKIPMMMLSQPIPKQNPDPIIQLKWTLASHLAGYGYQEIITYSLVGLEALNKLSAESKPLEQLPLRVANPMTAEQEYLRPNLRINLLMALSSNRKHEDGGIRLFELGKVYLPRSNDLPDEREVLCGLLSGAGLDKSWQNAGAPLDFYETKGVVESLLHPLGVELRFEQSSDESLHMAKQVAVIIGDSRVGVIGELHPKVLSRFEIDEPAYLFEIDLKTLLPFTLGYKTFTPIPKFPPMERDIALVIDTGVTNQEILDIIRGFSLVKEVVLFDVYSGDQVPKGKKSLAYRVTFQSLEHTLTDKEVNKVQQEILDKLSKDLGATLRT
ncbi:phenylalanine--tRNA ligase subunit beta [Chloroflexota bacterium]